MSNNKVSWPAAVTSCEGSCDRQRPRAARDQARARQPRAGTPTAEPPASSFRWPVDLRRIGAAREMYTVRDDSQDHRAARAQRTVSLRLRPQIQAVLSGKGQCRADRRQRSGCSRRSCAAGRSRPSSCEADDKTSDRATVEGVNLACVRATPARAAQGGRQLKRIVVDYDVERTKGEDPDAAEVAVASALAKRGHGGGMP